ncbi:MAG: hypothetical protein AAF765_00785 [Bacteroidota bacterium]
MKIKQLSFPLRNEPYNKRLFQVYDEQLEIQYGTVFLKKGTRIPEEGFTKHPYYEFSWLQSGKIEVLTEDGTVSGYLDQGDIVSLEPHEPQAGNVLEDTYIMYTLIKSNDNGK